VVVGLAGQCAAAVGVGGLVVGRVGALALGAPRAHGGIAAAAAAAAVVAGPGCHMPPLGASCRRAKRYPRFVG
jgi:hypothetical protein